MRLIEDGFSGESNEAGSGVSDSEAASVGAAKVSKEDEE